MSNYFLAKTDPQTYSISDFVAEKKAQKITKWDGVHNYQAVNVIKSWKIGDKVIIYHSMGKPKIVGLATVISPPQRDVNDTRNISWYAELELVREFLSLEQISLKQIKETSKNLNIFTDFALIKQSRLSTMLCPQEFITWLRSVGVDL